jgi:hypothetical protein
MMKHPEFDQMVALAERLRLGLDSSGRKNLVGSQIIPDKSHYRTLGLGPISLVRLPRKTMHVDYFEVVGH